MTTDESTMEIEKFLGKKYKLDRCENLDEILIEMGISSMMRKIAKTLTTTVQLTKKPDGTYSLNSTILLLTASQKFKPGEGKDITTQDGRKVNNVFTFEGNKLIEKQVGEKTMTIVREFSDNEMIATASIGDVVSTSWCKVVD